MGPFVLPDHKTTVFLTGAVAILIVTVLAALGTKILMRTMTIMIALFTLAVIVDFVIFLFTSRSEFINTFNELGGAGKYQSVVDAGEGTGLYPSEGGYSAKSTFGTLYFTLSVLFYVYWGTYIAAEVKRAGTRKRMLWSFLGGGLTQGAFLIVGLALMYKTVGEDFFISSTAGNSDVGFASFPFYAALVAGSDVPVILLSLAFLLWIIPGVNINMAMVQRGLFT